jgi:hypothetical protein
LVRISTYPETFLYHLPLRCARVGVDGLYRPDAVPAIRWRGGAPGEGVLPCDLSDR